MTLTFAAAVYFVVWWILLFVALPFAGRSQQEAGSIVPGTPASAPARPQLLRVVIVTTLLSAVVMSLVYAAIANQLIDLRGPVLEPAPAIVGMP